MKSQLIRLLLLQVVALGPIPAVAQKFQTNCTLPFEQIASSHPIDDACPKEGSSTTEAQRQQSMSKNNFCASGTALRLTLSQLVQLQQIVQEKNMVFGRPGSIKDRAVLRKMTMLGDIAIGEGSLVMVVGYLVDAHFSNVLKGENVNCKIGGSENNDISLVLGRTPDADRCSTITAEISPHFRPITWSRITEQKITKRVRITGQLFFDDAHRPCAEGHRQAPARASLWEIHPVYSIEICTATNPDDCNPMDDKVWTSLADWHDSGRAPAKIELRPSSSSVEVGSELSLVIALQDTDNNPVVAFKDFVVTVEFHLPSGKVISQRVAIAKGQGSQTTHFRSDETGVIRISALQSELLQGNTAIYVRPHSASILHRFATSPELIYVAHNSPQSGGGSRAPQSLVLSFNKRQFLADGKDPEVIDGFLIGHKATDDIIIEFSTTLGQFVADEQGNAALVIPKGSDHGKISLISRDEGTAIVKYVQSRPMIPVQGETQASVEFVPPIRKLKLQVSPPSISFADEADVIVKFLDDADVEHGFSKPRSVAFAIDSGHGGFEKSELTVPPRKSSDRTKFFPQSWGAVTISASTENLLSASTQFSVAVPVLLMSVSVIGGIIGGLIAFWTKKSQGLWRIAVGMVTGVVLYWAFVNQMMAPTARRTLLNPIGAFVVSTLGGWLGTAVFSWLASLLGYKAQSADAP